MSHAEKIVDTLLGENHVVPVRTVFASLDELRSYAEKHPQFLKKLGLTAEKAWKRNVSFGD